MITHRTLSNFTLRAGLPRDLATLGEIDADAGAIFEQAGLFLDLPENHEFPSAERRRWQECLASGTTLLAVDRAFGAVGFAAVGIKDDEPYLAQLSVRPRFMRLGIGGALLEAAIEMMKALGRHSMWLTTYRHLPWNLPFYERHGFVAIDERDCGAELLAEHAIERRWLPLPHERVVMRRTF